jgi:hypothetical protein
MKAPDGAAGKKARCPECKTVQYVPQAEPAMAGADDLGGLFAMEQAAPQSEAMVPSPTPQATLLTAAPASDPWQPSPVPPVGWSPDQVVVERETPLQPRRKVRPAGAGFSGVATSSAGLAGAVVGASIGAAIGAGIWAAVAYFTGYEIGYIAALVGALAGWGASAGGEQSPSVGAVAAVIGLVGICAGSYGAFYLTKNSDEVRQVLAEAIRSDLKSSEPEWHALPSGEKTARVEAELDALVAQIGYTDVMDTGDWLFMVLFGVLGLGAGYRIGSGASDD